MDKWSSPASFVMLTLPSLTHNDENCSECYYAFFPSPLFNTRGYKGSSVPISVPHVVNGNHPFHPLSRTWATGSSLPPFVPHVGPFGRGALSSAKSGRQEANKKPLTGETGGVTLLSSSIVPGEPVESQYPNSITNRVLTGEPNTVTYRSGRIGHFVRYIYRTRLLSHTVVYDTV
ncbi:hypothetical protein J6590_065991 [Homalodisca vitripennis]|nr:hypothetical protein J6590_065991 [Homalodisca vitripennis]